MIMITLRQTFEQKKSECDIMNKLTINEIMTILEREDNYYDFKEIYHQSKNNKELLKDILSLANCKHNGDRYIFFGIAENDEKFIVKGIENSPNRKKLVDIQSCLDSKYFACERVPDIDLYTIKTEDKHEIDVLVIKDVKFKPYFLIKDYENIKSHKIYTRHHDQKCEANSHDIIQMWKEQFGLTGDVKQKFNTLIKDVGKWQYNENKHTFINLIYPYYKVVIEKEYECPGKDAFMLNYGPHKAIACNAKFIVNKSEIGECPYVICDEYRNEYPIPDFHAINFDEETYGFYYYIKNTPKYLLFKLCEKNKLTVNRIGKIFPHIIFENVKEYEKYINFLAINNIFDKINIKQNDYSKIPEEYCQNINLDSLSKFVSFYHDYKNKERN